MVVNEPEATSSHQHPGKRAEALKNIFIKQKIDLISFLYLSVFLFFIREVGTITQTPDWVKSGNKKDTFIFISYHITSYLLG